MCTIDLGEAYLERPDYSEYWHSVMAQLIGAYFKADAYKDVVHRGTEFMQQISGVRLQYPYCSLYGLFMGCGWNGPSY